MALTFNSYQELAQGTDIALDGLFAKYPDLPQDVKKMLEMAYAGLGLGESGEVQNNVKKMIRDDHGVVTDEKRDKIKGELGDQLWYIAKMCEENGLKMGDVAQFNLDKLYSRKERGVIQGSGDNR